MPIDSNNLMQNVYDYFLTLYNNSQSNSDASTFLSFEQIGHPISPKDFTLAGQTGFSPALVIEHLSSLANFVPIFSRHNFTADTDRRVEDQYEMILAGAQPFSAADADMNFFASLKSLAQKKFDDEKLGSLDGPFQYHPCYADPVDWYDPAATNWTPHSFSTQQSSSLTDTTAPTPQAPVPSPVALGAMWRSAPTQAHIVSVVQRFPQVAVNLIPQVRSGKPIAPRPGAVVPLAQPRPLTARPVVGTVGGQAPAPVRVTRPQVGPEANRGVMVRPATPPQVHPLPLYQQVVFNPSLSLTQRAAIRRAMAQSAVPHNVSSDNFSISFDYCMVRVTRPWLYEPFLLDKNWYIPGYKDGAFCSGNSQDQSGLLPAVPIALLVVKNLRITANWSESDTQHAQNAIALGPFALDESKFENSTLFCEGTQAIAWIFGPLPRLPANADPTLKASPAVPAAS